MSNIIEHDGDDLNGSLSVDGGQSSVSLETYQAIYQKITGRSEKTVQKYHDNILVDFSELEQMHMKVMQLCDVHTIIAQNEVVTVFHEKERKEQFVSFDDFKRYNSSSSKPTVSVVIKYNFSILPPKGNSPQEYVVTIRFNSRVAMLNAIEKEAPAFMRGRIIRMVTYHTSEISVEYTDYVVAKSFLDTFNEWIEGCNTHPRNRCVEIAQSYSHFLPLVIKMIVVALFVTSGIKAIPLLTAGASLEELAKSALILSTGFYVLVLLAGVVGKWTESSIDNIHQLSYLKINKGDAKLIENFSDRNRTSLYKFVIGAFFSFGLSVMASKLSMLI